MKPKEFVNFIQENSNSNGTLKSAFVLHYLSKLNEKELKGLRSSVDKAIRVREKGMVDDKIAYLKSLGYKISK
jgi:hypothetical protein